MQESIESKLSRYRAQLIHLESCFRMEVAKDYRERSAGCLLFLWKEISICNVVLHELEAIASLVAGDA